MLHQPRLVYRVALPLLVVLFGLSAIGRDRTPSEGGTYWVGALSWAAFGVLSVALIAFSLVVLVARRRTGRQ